MSHYVVGDVHGQERLFTELLEKINFSPARDKLYLLGDVVSEGPSTLPIFERLLAQPETYYFVMGNHEDNFLINLVPYLDRLRGDPQVIDALLKAHALCPNKSVLPILETLNSKAELSAAATGAKPPNDGLLHLQDKWADSDERSGTVQALREALERLKACLGNDQARLCASYRCLIVGLWGFRYHNTYEHLLPEFARLDETSYWRIIRFLKAQPFARQLCLNGKRILLIHYLFRGQVNGPGDLHADWFYRGIFPSLHYWGSDPRPDLVLFGHIPVFRWLELSAVDFNPLEALSYYDEKGTRYVNLDLIEGGTLGAYRLEDDTCFYVRDGKCASYEY